MEISFSGKEARSARNRVISFSVSLVVLLVQSVVLGSRSGLARTMSDGNRWRIDGIMVYLNRLCFVCKSSSCKKQSILWCLRSIFSLMYCWAKVCDPIGWPRNLTPCVISACSGSSGERKASACWRFRCCSGSRLCRGETPVVAVRIVVLRLLRIIPSGFPSSSKRWRNQRRSQCGRHTDVSSIMDAVWLMPPMSSS